MSDHERWEELAAGHALSALEPAEEAEFSEHLAGCDHCQEVLADHTFVAAQLGTLADSSDAPSWDRIRAGIVSERPVPSLDEARARRRAPRWLSAAAGLVLLAGGAVVWQAAQSDSPSAQQAALSSCAAEPGCRVVRLADKATLLVSGSGVRVLPTLLGTPPAGRVYVLWQLPRDGRPTMVASLTETHDGKVGEAHLLALPYEDTAAFGLSLERSDAVPTKPSKVIAVGSA